jgi:EmrB/QacA subfamily drug resistance transporter
MNRTVLFIVASALFMENLDSTVLATALPVMARDLGVDAVHMKLALTSYLLALAIFVPVSGWAADRFGARRVFVGSVLVFTIASAFCGLSGNLVELVIWRLVQGLGGAMMVPVGRLVVVKSVPKEGFVAAMAWFTVPALIGPLLGPPLGGLVVSVLSWHWVFWLNIPVGLAGALLGWRHVPDIREADRTPFDMTGFLLVGTGVALVVSAATLIGVGQLSTRADLLMGLAGLCVLLLYARHARNVARPVLDLTLLRLATFRASVIGGMPFRIGVAATPFLLPLLLQLGFGFSPLASGLTTFATALGAIAMKFVAQPILARFGFRGTLIWNGLLAAALAAVPALFSATTPAGVIMFVLLVSGFLRSLQFTAVNSITFADVPPERMGAATAFSQVAQQVSASIGVSFAAMGLDLSRALHGDAGLTASDFSAVFSGVALIAALSCLAYMRLPENAAADLTRRHAPAPQS